VQHGRAEVRAARTTEGGWPLTAADIPLGSTWTLSNIAEGPVQMELEAGYGIAVAYPGA
jgi:thiamine pyrophosphokinase